MIKKYYLNLIYILLFIITNKIYAQEQCKVVNHNANFKKNYYSLVIDTSDSMYGSSFSQSKIALEEFINSIDINNSFISLIQFDSKVRLISNFTNNKNLLLNNIKNLKLGGASTLYDGIAKGIQLLDKKEGNKTLIFLSDGNDNESKFLINDLSTMNINENILVYGIGIGDINHSILEKIANITKGSYYPSYDSHMIIDLYQRIQEISRQYYFNQEKDGSLLINSIPSGKEVYLDNIKKGITPLKLIDIDSGEYNLKIKYNNKISLECNYESKDGIVNTINPNIKKENLSFNLNTIPGEAAVFIDDAFIGFSGIMGNIQIKNITSNKHKIKIITVANLNFDVSQKFEFEINIKPEIKKINVIVFSKQIILNDGAIINQSKENMMNDINNAFDDLDNSFTNY